MAALRLSCLARNGQSPGEESLSAAIAVQAIEAQPALGQIRPMRGQVLAGALNSIFERIRGSYRSVYSRRFVFQAKKEKTWRAERRPRVVETDRTPRLGLLRSVRRATRSRHAEERVRAPIPNNSTMEPQSHLLLAAASMGGRGGTGATPLPRVGFFTIDMLAQAVPPTVIAPMTANASRHHSEGTPIWANARVTS